MLDVKVYYQSVRDGDRLGPMSGEFRSWSHLRGRVTREFRGLSAYWRVVVTDQDGNDLGSGVRAGRGGTGERWVWDGQAAVPARKR